MERIKALNWYQSALLLLMAVAAVAFAIIYPTAMQKVGFLYKNAVLAKTQSGENTVYSGKVGGKQVSFAVFADKTVEFNSGEKVYGPYQVKKDSTAVPASSDLAGNMVGIEVLCNQEIIFRGGALDSGGTLLLFNEDGSSNLKISTSINGVETDLNGNPIDADAPSVSTILELIQGPELLSKGHWGIYFLGVLVCALNAVSILFADELFRFGLILTVRNVDDIEPTGFEIASRYIVWTIFAALALAIFIFGLK